MSDGGERIDVGRLLTIDVAAELRKLSQAQLQGPWQIPAEFVRRALKHGASEVDVSLGRQHARIVDDARGIAPELLQWTAVLLDAQRGNSERHTALTVLESHGELALLAVAGLPPRELTIRAREHGVMHVLEHGNGRPRVTAAREPGPDGTEVVLAASGLERRTCHDWLIDAAKFANAGVRIDGKLVPHGFAHAFAHVELRTPLRGRLAIPSEGETAHAWLLEHGIVTGHVAIPDAPCFEAALELGSDATDGSAARLREALQPHVLTLVDQAVALLVRMAPQANTLPETARARLARLLLQAARKQQRVSEVMRAEVFRVVDTQGERLVDLASLQRTSNRDPTAQRMLQAIYPGQRPERFAIGETPVLVADEVERSLLAELLQVRFRAPDARDAQGSWTAAWRRSLDATGRGLGRLSDLVRHPFRGRAVDDDMLDPREQGLLETLRRHLARDPHRTVESITMCAGAGPIRRTRGPAPQLLLPRRNPTVRACATAIAHDRQWAYPAYLVLLEGFALPPEDLRRAWLSRGEG